MFCSKMWKTYKYHDYQQVEEEIIDQERYGLKTHGKVDNETGTVMDCEDRDYIELRAKYEYRNDCFYTNKYSHFIKIIKSRGFKVQAQFSQTSEKGVKEVKKDMVELKEEQYDKMCKDYNEYITPIKTDINKQLLDDYNMSIKDITDEEDLIWYKKQYDKKCMVEADNWYDYDKYYTKQIVQLNDILKIPYNELDKFKGIFINPLSIGPGS